MKTTVETMANGQKKVTNPCVEPCSVERGMRILGGKWKASILWHLQDGPVRFNDLARMLGGASKKNGRSTSERIGKPRFGDS